jgi:hypothetical protein
MARAKVWIPMRFGFSSMHAAYKLRDAIRELGLPAEIRRQSETWFVETDSRILEHADKVTRFIYGGSN